MNIEEIYELKHISIFEDKRDKVCLYSEAVLHPIMKHYHPTAIRYIDREDSYVLYDYSHISLNLLKKEYLEDFDTLHVYNCLYSKTAIPCTKLSNVTLQQAQQIINNNVLLFSKVNEKLIQDKLLMQIEEL